MTDRVPPDAWDRPDPADPRDRTFAQALRDPPPDPPVVLLGLPFDGAVLGRRGAREGPAALREALAGMKTSRLDRHRTAIAAADWGDADLPPEAPVDEAHDAAREAAREARQAGATLVALGGDHSLTYPLARPHAEAVEALGVVNVDAHLDVRAVDGPPNSGSSFGRLLRDDLVAGPHLVEVGLRDFATSRTYVDWARDRGATLVPAAEARRRDPSSLLADLYGGPLEGVDAVYLSLDVDALDQADAPGVSAPTPGGLTSARFAALAREAVRQAPAPVAGVDVVETAPRHDPTDRTARAAALALAHVLAELPGGSPP